MKRSRNDPRILEGLCELDGQPLRDHVSCEGCDLLVGSKHLAQSAGMCEVVVGRTRTTPSGEKVTSHRVDGSTLYQMMLCNLCQRQSKSGRVLYNPALSWTDARPVRGKDRKGRKPKGGRHAVQARS